MEQFAQELLHSMPYVGLAIVLMLTGMGLPLPEDIPLLISGVICAEGHADIRIMIPVAIFFTVFSDCILYVMGRRYGHHINKFPFLKKYVTEKNMSRAEGIFKRHGGKTLFLSRFMPGVRAALYVSAGLFKVPFWKMIVFDGGAALISVPAWILLAYFFADNYDSLKGDLKLIILGAVALAVIGFLVWHFMRKKEEEVEEAIAPIAAPTADDVERLDPAKHPDVLLAGAGAITDAATEAETPVPPVSEATDARIPDAKRPDSES